MDITPFRISISQTHIHSHYILYQTTTTYIKIQSLDIKHQLVLLFYFLSKATRFSNIQQLFAIKLGTSLTNYLPTRLSL